MTITLEADTADPPRYVVDSERNSITFTVPGTISIPTGNLYYVLEDPAWGVVETDDEGPFVAESGLPEEGDTLDFKIKLRRSPEQGNLPANAPADIPFEIRALDRGVPKADGTHKDLALKGSQLGTSSLPRAVPGTDFVLTNPVIIESGASEATFSVTVVDDGVPERPEWVYLQVVPVMKGRAGRAFIPGVGALHYELHGDWYKRYTYNAETLDGEDPDTTSINSIHFPIMDDDPVEIGFAVAASTVLETDMDQEVEIRIDIDPEFPGVRIAGESLGSFSNNPLYLHEVYLRVSGTATEQPLQGSGSSLAPDPSVTDGDYYLVPMLPPEDDMEEDDMEEDAMPEDASSVHVSLAPMIESDGSRVYRLLFPTGVTSINLRVNVRTDDTIEAVETVVLQLLEPTEAIQGALADAARNEREPTLYNVRSSTDEHVLNISSKDVLTAGFRHASSVVNEAGGGSVNVEVVLADGATALTGGLPLDYAVGRESTAVAGTDYNALSGTLTIPEGRNSADITVTAIDNSSPTAPDDLNIVLVLSDSANAMASPDNARHTVTILDDENPKPPTVTLRSDAVSVVENAGSGGAVTLMVVLDKAITNALQVPLNISGTATHGSSGDYTLSPAPSGGVVSLTFSPDGGQVPAPIELTITPRDDSVRGEGVETVIVTIGSISGGAAGEPSSYTLQIADDDLLMVGFQAASSTFTEGSEDTAAITVTLNAAPTNPLSVQITSGGASDTAIAGSDYSLIPLVIPAGDRTAELEVEVFDDGIDSGSRTLTLNIAPGSGYSVRTGQGAHQLTINDDDILTVWIQGAKDGRGASGQWDWMDWASYRGRVSGAAREASGYPLYMGFSYYPDEDIPVSVSKSGTAEAAFNVGSTWSIPSTATQRSDHTLHLSEQPNFGAWNSDASTYGYVTTSGILGLDYHFIGWRDREATGTLTITLEADTADPPRYVVDSERNSITFTVPGTIDLLTGNLYYVLEDPAWGVVETDDEGPFVAESGLPQEGDTLSIKIKLRDAANSPVNAPADIPFEIRPLDRGVPKADGTHKDLALKGSQLGTSSLPRAVPGTDFALTNPVIIESGASEATFSVTVVDDGVPERPEWVYLQVAPVMKGRAGHALIPGVGVLHYELHGDWYKRYTYNAETLDGEDPDTTSINSIHFPIMDDDPVEIGFATSSSAEGARVAERDVDVMINIDPEFPGVRIAGESRSSFSNDPLYIHEVYLRVSGSAIEQPLQGSGSSLAPDPSVTDGDYYLMPMLPPEPEEDEEDEEDAMPEDGSRVHVSLAPMIEFDGSRVYRLLVSAGYGSVALRLRLLQDSQVGVGNSVVIRLELLEPSDELRAALADAERNEREPTFYELSGRTVHTIQLAE